MALKSILVHVTGAPDSAARVSTALDLAMEHDAHLTGLAVRPAVQIPTYAAANIPDSVFQEVEARQDATDIAARDGFLEAAAQAGWSEERLSLLTQAITINANARVPPSSAP